MSRATLGKTLLLTATVAFGIAAAWFTAVMWNVTIVQNALRHADHSEQLMVGVDGEPVIVRTSYATGASETMTLSGEKSRITSQDLLYPNYIQNRKQTDAFPAVVWNWRLASINDGGAPAVYWYLVHDGRSPGRAYGVGYHSATKTRVGYFGRSGFRETLPPRDDWFEIASRHGLYGATLMSMAWEPGVSQAEPILPLLADGKLWAIDVGQRKVRAVADCPRAFAVGQAWQLPAEIPPKNPDITPQPAQSNTPMKVVVRQPDSLIVLDRRGEKQATYPLPAELDDAMLAAYLRGDGNLLLILARADAQANTTYEMMLLDAAGRIIKQEPVRLASNVIAPSFASVGWVAALTAPAPLASGLIVGLAPIGLVRSGQVDSYWAGVVKVVGAFWMSIVVVLAISTGCAVAAYRRQRRYGLPHAGVWAAFVFVCGIAGWIAYRFHRRWPVLEDCPACGEPTPRDREACLDCGAAFPPPALKGIEVFA